MNRRKIWIWSIIFGVLSAILLYLALFPPPEQSPEEVVRQEQTEEETVEEPIKPTPQMKPALGMRAISVPVNEVQGIAGYLVPETLVDVIVTFPALEGGDFATQLLLQNKRVLSVGNRLQQVEKEEELDKNEETAGNESNDGDAAHGSRQSISEDSPPIDYKLVTLEVTPWEGAALALAVQQGSIYLMLRSAEDLDFEPNHRITQDQLHRGVNRHDDALGGNSR